MSTAGLVDALPALRIRKLRLLLAGQAVSFVGDALFPVALAFAVLDELDGSAGELGLVLAAQALPLALLILVAGVWADRMPRQRLMLVSDFGRMVVQGVIAALLLTGAAELWTLIALVAVYGVFEAFFRPAAGGLIPQVAGPEHLQQANALMGLAQNVGIVLGPTLGGLLVVTIGPGAAIGVDALTFLVSAVFLIRMGSVPAARAAEAASGFWSELRGGARARDRRPRARRGGELGGDRDLLRGRDDPRGGAVAAAAGRAPDARVRGLLPRRRLPADHHRLRGLHGGDRGVRAARRHRRERRLHPVGDDPRARDPARRPVTGHLAGLVLHRGRDAPGVRGRGGRGGGLRDAPHDARRLAGGARAAPGRPGGGRRPPAARPCGDARVVPTALWQAPRRGAWLGSWATAWA